MAIQIHICKRCSKQFKPKRSEYSTFCGRDCSSSFQKEHAASADELINRRKARERERRRVFAPIACSICHSTFVPKGRHHKVCSDGCRAEHSRQVSRAINQARGDVDKSPRHCRECDQVFSPAYGDKHRTYCSKACGRKAGRRVSRLRRKAKQRSVQVEPVNPMRVFERDGWRCQLCGRKTPRSLRGSLSDRAPELDHILPLGKGGSHEYRNTQCACRLCNAAKKDKPLGQTLLFG